MAEYRNLQPEEITKLEAQGCYCANWSDILVRDGFNPSFIRHTNFSGKNRLGTFNREFNFPGGVVKHAGISYATIHNTNIGNNVYISQVRNQIANYNIGNNVVIENVDALTTEGESTFGNGQKVAVLNEAGGREVPIFNELSAHTAYLMAFYRHRPALIEKLTGMVEQYCHNIKSDRGTVAENAKIINSRTILNVNIGPGATVEGIYRLVNGTINSSMEHPSYFGPGVIAEDFIATSGAEVTDATLISKCFIGQGCSLGKHYSAENSVFFANCQGFHGEACSIFAGPYTVSHHKSTLLIAGYYSFLNAGSGSNQSNHMYKLGPVHQGVVERGSKTTSDSYLLWPAKIGPFSLVMGRHYRNPDTSNFPFSYLIENHDESYLAPGVNLRSVGTMRDARKWPGRDKRKDSHQLDFITFNLLSPYSVEKMIKGKHTLQTLKKTSGITSEYFMYNSVKIEDKALDRGINMYNIGILKFLGNGLLKKLEKGDFQNIKEIQDTLKPDTEEGSGDWVDMAGLVVPKEEVILLIEKIESGVLNAFDDLQAIYKKWHQNYYSWVWNWSVKIFREEMGIDLKNIEKEALLDFINQWKNAVVSLDEMMLTDARKEFTLKAQTGFGMDGEDDVRHTDFEQVRGAFEKHPAVRDIFDHIEKKQQLATQIREKINQI
ncbi:DUF4954 family protein [Marinilabilia salmonicolor]|jgi:hypothetical protein|uniref:Uncharacterized protein DUF4954 n=1 Tax=Marinilabilia salmonicolor TaxID=989 RepID=A0A2T0WXK9_9BACT|nr:DUF4954 family protein [Marinilabilia salmonicolor]PRY91397.1 uncharacterized protein DUF4954 [Marinilabilia salmonicolor]RCW37513.1 uncharacterized protein DUF4954 [Marinilabilia salmonicolor]